jgi:hypothetical protein
MNKHVHVFVLRECSTTGTTRNFLVILVLCRSEVCLNTKLKMRCTGSALAVSERLRSPGGRGRPQVGLVQHSHQGLGACGRASAVREGAAALAPAPDVAPVVVGLDASVDVSWTGSE